MSRPTLIKFVTEILFRPTITSEGHFNLLTFKYDMITGQCNVCDIGEKVSTNFHNTVTGLLS